MADSDAAAVRAWLADRSGTSPADWHLVSKGRHALLVVFAALADAAGAGRVVAQPLTCLTAVNPILAAGHGVAWGDIDADTLALDPATVPAGAAAVVAQHTLGPMAPVEAIAAAAGGAVVVEDAAHCLGHVSPAADVSVHSFGYEKLLPTRLGGAVWVNPAARQPAFAAALRARLAALPFPSRGAQVAFRTTRPLRRAAAVLPAVLRDAVNAAAERAALSDPAIAHTELAGAVPGPPTRLSGAPLAAVARALRDFPADESRRREVAAAYLAAADGLPGWTVPAAFRAGGCLARFPLLARDAASAAAAFDALAARGRVPGRWYRPLLFPGPADPGRYGLDPALTPVASDVSARILNLSVAPHVTARLAKETVHDLPR